MPDDWTGFNLGNNAPFQLSSFALSLLLVFRCAALRWRVGAAWQALCPVPSWPTCHSSPRPGLTRARPAFCPPFFPPRQHQRELLPVP